MVNAQHPSLEKRFLPPSDWQKGAFYNDKSNHNIFYNHLISKDSKANVVILPGLSEFGEKYIETACFLKEQGFNSFIIDWAYQGRSIRFEPNPYKRHSDGYDQDVLDLENLINNLLNNELPIMFLGHSMGCHIAMRYLLKHKHSISAASFSAPMLKPLAFRYTTSLYRLLLNFFPKKLMHSYVPGGKDWHYQSRKNNGKDIFSSDPIRDAIHNTWSEFDPALRIGNPTYQWVKETLDSIKFLETQYDQIKTPILLAIAEEERLVDNKEILKAHSLLDNSEILNLPTSKHEIMMERDEIRSVFLSETIDLFKKSM